jgi:hypothetical protein
MSVLLVDLHSLGQGKHLARRHFPKRLGRSPAGGRQHPLGEYGMGMICGLFAELDVALDDAVALDEQGVHCPFARLDGVQGFGKGAQCSGIKEGDGQQKGAHVVNGAGRNQSELGHGYLRQVNSKGAEAPNQFAEL